MSFILFRYFLVQTVVRSASLLGILLVLYGAIDYIETTSFIASSQLYRFYFYKLPQIISHMAPLVFAIGGLLAVSSMKNRGEWGALESVGISPRWLCAAILLLPILVLPLGWNLVHRWAPSSVRLFESAAGFRSQKPLQFGKSKDWIQMRIPGEDINRVLLLRRDKHGKPAQLIVGNEHSRRILCRWQSDQSAAVQRTVPRHLLQLPRTIPGTSLNGVLGATVPSGELNKLIEQLTQTGVSSVSYQAVIGLRHALVVAIVSVPLVALTLFVWLPSQSSLMAVVIAIVTGGTYWVSLLLGWMMVKTGLLPVWTLGSSGFLGTTILVILAAGIRRLFE